MLALLNLIPAWGKIVAGGLIVAGLVIGVLWVRSTWKEEGRRECEEANRAAVEKQIKDDRALSARLVADLQRQIQDLEANANADRAEIIRLPPGDCGPAVDRAVDILRSRRPARPAQ